MLPSAADLLSDAVKERARAHYANYDAELRDVRLRTEARFQSEVGRLKESVANSPIGNSAMPAIAAITDYVGWLGWSFWCASHLAPPLKLTADHDVRRFAAAMIVYAGPRLMDDGLDNHLSYKEKRATIVGSLASSYPDLDHAAIRAHAVLAGMWVMLYGFERLGRHGCPGAEMRTRRLCETIAPGVLVEGLVSTSLDWTAYEHVVLLKSVRYDQILYLNLVDPTPDPVRSMVLRAGAHVSRLSQYLNDVSDHAADHTAGQVNLLKWFTEPTEIRRLCAKEIASLEQIFAELPGDVGNAIAAATLETLDAANRLESAKTENHGSKAN
jgi:hypothetical protein